MRGIFQLASAAAGMWMMAATANAQYQYPYPGQDPYYRSDPYSRQDPYSRSDPYANGRYGNYTRGYDPVDQTLGDLERAEQYAYRGGRHHEFEEARRDLVRFRERWARGRYDRGRLDSAIGHVQDLVNSRWLAPSDRNVLGRDLYALRDFRSGRRYGPY